MQSPGRLKCSSYAPSSNTKKKEIKLSQNERVIPFSHALCIGALIIILLGLVMAALKDNPDAETVFTDIADILMSGLAAIALFYGAKQSRHIGKRIYYAWMVIAISRVAWCIGSLIWTYTELVLHESPFPSSADPFYLLSSPLLLLGILLLPSVKKFTPVERLKMAMDVGIVAITGILLIWIYLIAPTIEAYAGEETASIVIIIVEELILIILLITLLELIFRKIPAERKNTLLILAGGIFLLIIFETIYYAQDLSGTYNSGGWVDIGWLAAYVLMGLAGISQASDVHRGAFNAIRAKPPDYSQLNWPLYLPYLSIACAFTLLIWSDYQYIGISVSTVAWVAALIIGLVIVRQIIVLNENARLIQELQKEIKVREEAEKEIKRLNEELERRVEQRTSQLEVANLELQKEVIERKQAEMAVKNSERRLADIINFLPDPTFAIDRNSTVIVWNMAMETLTGIKAKDMLGKGNFEYSLPFYRFRRPILADLLLGKYEGYHDEYFNFAKDSTGVTGEVFISSFGPTGSYLLAKATTLSDADGNLVGAIETIRDMTERRLMEQKLERTRTELHIAAEIQRRFIPEKTPTIRDFDLAAITIPAMEVGGDYFDIVSLPDGKYGLVIADVAGKGIPAALFMALSRTIVRANATNQSDISEILRTANNIIAMDAISGMFVTLMYGVLNEKAHTFNYVNAGHPPPMIFRSKTRIFERGEVTGIALGAKEGAKYEERIIKLSPGDLIVFYTDGVTESMNSKGEFYGLNRLNDIVGRSFQLSAKQLMREVLNDVAKFSGVAEQNDDFTLMVLKASKHYEEHSEIVVAASVEEIPKVTTYIDEVMFRAGFNKEMNLEVQLAVEELCINIIQHGYHGAEGTILIASNSNVDCIMITIEDNAWQFDPTMHPEPNLGDDLDKRPIGGLGIHLVRSLIDEMNYEFKDGKNKLILIKKKKTGTSVVTDG